MKEENITLEILQKKKWIKFTTDEKTEYVIQGDRVIDFAFVGGEMLDSGFRDSYSRPRMRFYETKEGVLEMCRIVFKPSGFYQNLIIAYAARKNITFSK